MFRQSATKSTAILHCLWTCWKSKWMFFNKHYSWMCLLWAQFVSVESSKTFSTCGIHFSCTKASNVFFLHCIAVEGNALAFLPIIEWEVWCHILPTPMWVCKDYAQPLPIMKHGNARHQNVNLLGLFRECMCMNSACRGEVLFDLVKVRSSVGRSLGRCWLQLAHGCLCTGCQLEVLLLTGSSLDPKCMVALKKWWQVPFLYTCRLYSDV